MAYVPPNRTPVLNLGRENETPEDNEASPKSLYKLPWDVRVMVYEYHFDKSEPVPSAHSQPDLTMVSGVLRKEALPVFYERSTFEATLDIWSLHKDEGLATTLSLSTDDMPDNVPQQYFSLVTKIRLVLNFNMVQKRLFEVTFDLKQWHGFARAVRIERITPAQTTQYEDIFMDGIRDAMEMVFADIVPQKGKRISCEQVLSVAETAVEEWFYYQDKDEWLEMACLETLDALGVL